MQTYRVAHIVGGLNRGGAETWVVRAAEQLRRSRYVFDFFVHGTGEYDYEADVRRIGARVIRVPEVSRLRYPAVLAKLLRAHGPYEIAHSHQHHFGALQLLSARLAGVPVRIAHSHSDTSRIHKAASRRFYETASRALLRHSATHAISVSENAERDLCGRRPRNAALLPCGIYLEPFEKAPEERDSLRTELGIADARPLLVHVGRLAPEKNHAFLVDTMRTLTASAPKAVMLFVGDGPLQSELRRSVTSAGLDAHIRFVGKRADVASLLAIADVFVFPSLWEGLPLSLIEAQAAGLPCLVSDRVTRQVEIVRGLVQFLPVDAPASVWAAAALAATQRHRSESDRRAALAEVKASAFNIVNSAEQLVQFYTTAIEGVAAE